MKTCTGCKKELNVSLFTKNILAKDGLSFKCKKCESLRRSKKSKFIKSTQIINFITIDGERWEKIDGFDYEVSNYGRVRSIYREFINSRGRKRQFNAFLLKQADVGGYCNISMSVITESGKRKQKLFSVHRLVALAFIPNPNNYNQVNHKDGIKSNNFHQNLEWCTLSQNRQHAYDIGLQKGPIGEKQGNSTLTTEEVLQIRKIGRSKTLTEIAKKFNTSFGNVSDILLRRSWKHI